MSRLNFHKLTTIREGYTKTLVIPVFDIPKNKENLTMYYEK